MEEPEGHFNIDEYTDVVMVTKPVIYISVQEICDTHTLLLDHKDEIAPDSNDPLHELLDDLGDAPCIEALLGNTTQFANDCITFPMLRSWNNQGETLQLPRFRLEWTSIRMWHCNS